MRAWFIPNNLRRKREMKKVLKGFMVVMMLSLFFGMGSQAAVRRVSVGKVTQLRIKASHKVKRKP